MDVNRGTFTAFSVSVKNPGAYFTSKILVNQDLEHMLLQSEFLDLSPQSVKMRFLWKRLRYYM